MIFRSVSLEWILNFENAFLQSIKPYDKLTTLRKSKICLLVDEQSASQPETAAYGIGAFDEPHEAAALVVSKRKSISRTF